LFQAATRTGVAAAIREITWLGHVPAGILDLLGDPSAMQLETVDDAHRHITTAEGRIDGRTASRERKEGCCNALRH
jgi:hypothetical protein